MKGHFWEALKCCSMPGLYDPVTYDCFYFPNAAWLASWSPLSQSSSVRGAQFEEKW
jgi:hypothetical protein